MKISNREKVMLCILGSIVLGIGYYKFVYKSLSQKVVVAENKKDETENKYNAAVTTVQNIENRKSDLKILKSQILNCSEGFYPTISEEHIILELNQLLTGSGLKGGIKFDPIVTQSVEKSEKESVNIPESSVQKFVDQYSKLNPNSGIQSDTMASGQDKNTDTSNNNSKSSQIGSGNSNDKNNNFIQYLNCSITFSGTYENLNTFLKSIRESKRKIIVNSLSTAQDSANGINGKIKLEIYSIPKIDNELEEYLKWNLDGSSNGTATFSSNPISDIENNEDENVDFVLSSKPMIADLPSVIIGKANDSTRTTYVYADSNKTEEVELVLTQEGDKYYYKYKTSKGTYPKDFNGKGVEFIPALSTSINVDVFSESRTDSDDEAGVKLKITNNTDMLVNVNIIGDDTTNPRITVDGDSSKVSVNQK
ncbi:MAG TPA: pilus assembly protein PilO [Clostridium sp.]|nr:pilus assembly protein PilO [Clostridium sp.]